MLSYYTYCSFKKNAPVSSNKSSLVSSRIWFHIAGEEISLSLSAKKVAGATGQVANIVTSS
jgi:hypothetical protein